MTSARTFKTLAYLMGAMTAVTLLLSLVEPLTVSLRTQPAAARADESNTSVPALASTPPASWEHLELVLARQTSDKPVELPESHLIIQPNGHVDATSLWRLGQPLPQHILRVCAVYTGQPSDTQLSCWLKTCDQAAQQMNMRSARITLSATGPANRSPAQFRQLRDLQRRLIALLADSSST